MGELADRRYKEITLGVPAIPGVDFFERGNVLLAFMRLLEKAGIPEDLRISLAYNYALSLTEAHVNGSSPYKTQHQLEYAAHLLIYAKKIKEGD